MKNKYKLGVFILCMFLVVGLLPQNAQANDTRNRILTYDLDISHYVLNWNSELDPYESTNTRSRSGRATLNGNVGVVANGTTISFINPITFNTYYPKSIRSTPHETAAQPRITIQRTGAPGSPPVGGAIAMPLTEVDWVTFDNETFVKGIQLLNYSAIPNSLYHINIYNLPLGTYKNVSNRYYDKIYDSNLNRVIGVNRSTYGNNRAAAFYAPEDSSSRVTLNFYTPARPPSITVSNVTTNRADIQWSNVNPAGTNYTLQYRILTGSDVNNESHWSTWQNIAIDGRDSTVSLGTTASIFQPDNTYQLRVRVNHYGGSYYNVYSNYVIFSTSADPAVRAAQEAAIAAQAAKEAAEQTLQYSLDAKQSADSALQQINNPTYGLENIYNKIQTVENKVADIQFPPTVEKLIGINNTTATKGNSVLVELVVDNANICRYKVNEGDYGNWISIEAVDYISVELGSTPGIKNIMMQFAQGIQDEGGNYIVTSPLKSKGLKIFKL